MMVQSKYVVAIAVGGLLDGLTLVGTWRTHDEAREWAERMVRGPAWDVVEVEPPDDVA